MNRIETLGRIIVANELSGNLELAYRFSDPDGVHSGKSGWSFGRCQFDLLNNPRAARCLAEAGFSGQEIATLVSQHYNAREMVRLNTKLAAAAPVVDRYDAEELEAIVEHTEYALQRVGIRLTDEETFLHLCDYHNQFYISLSGKCITHLLGLKRVVTSADVLAYKLTTRWGRKREDDVERRYNNIVRICGGDS